NVYVDVATPQRVCDVDAEKLRELGGRQHLSHLAEIDAYRGMNPEWRDLGRALGSYAGLQESDVERHVPLDDLDLRGVIRVVEEPDPAREEAITDRLCRRRESQPRLRERG